VSATALPSTSPGRRRLALGLLWLALPVLALGSQIASKLVADALLGATLGWPLVLEIARMPVAWAVVACELASLGAWMVVLSEVSLSAAFSISALSYVLVIAASWGVFGEAVSGLQIAGGAAILTGVWLIGRDS
jgi:drug/metabolite transporter (DMT)-like permease